MAQIQQIQLRFNAEEDRLLLRLGTDDNCEYRFWLTRRYVRLLWPVLRQLLGSAAAAASAAADEAATQAVVSFRHEQAVQEADFATPFQESGHHLPIGEAPMLLCHLQLKSGTDGAAILALYPQQGQGVEIAMSEPLLHGFCRLLADAVATADWDIDCSIAPGVQPQQGSRSNVN